MKKLFVGLALVAGLSGCLPTNPNVATPSQAVVAINAYNTAVATGKNYLSLPLCPSAPLCRTAELSQSVYTALKNGRVARKQILAALASNSAAPITAIQALEAAYSVIQQIPVK